MNRFPRPSKIRRRSGDRRHVTIVAAIGAVLALGGFAAESYVAARHPAIAAAGAPGDDEIYTGSILYMPAEGKICRQMLFDNHTGQFSDNGYVDCERAAYHGQGGPPKEWSAARMHVISSGFRRR
jgi:hypothetical protein